MTTHTTYFYTYLCALISCSFMVEALIVYEKLRSPRIKNFETTKCEENYDYITTVEDVKLDIDSDGNAIMSGSMFVKADLVKPLQAQVHLFLVETPLIIPIPCLSNNIGTCYYEDLCKFGYPSSTDCPSHFIEDEVPCRCPIAEGNYTLSPTFQLGSVNNLQWFMPGTYNGKVNIATGEKEISCYTFSFDLYNDVEDPSLSRKKMEQGPNLSRTEMEQDPNLARKEIEQYEYNVVLV